MRTLLLFAAALAGISVPAQSAVSQPRITPINENISKVTTDLGSVMVRNDEVVSLMEPAADGTMLYKTLPIGKKSPAKAAEGKVNLTVKAGESSNGKVTELSGVAVYRDGKQVTLKSSGASHTISLEPGDYMLQVKYNFGSGAFIFLEVKLEGDTTITTTPDMADKLIEPKFYLPDGNEIVMPTLDANWEPTDEPYNLNQMLGLTKLTYKGLGSFSAVTNYSFGGNLISKYLAYYTNILDKDLEVFWFFGGSTTDGKAISTSIAVNGTQVGKDGIVKNDPSQYCLIDPKFQRSPAYEKYGDGNNKRSLGASLYRPDGWFLGGMSLTFKDYVENYLCSPPVDFTDTYLAACVGDVDIMDAAQNIFLGTVSPEIIRSTDGLRYSPIQSTQLYQYISSGSLRKPNELFALPMDGAPLLGTTTPYMVTITENKAWNKPPYFVPSPLLSVGNYGELRNADLNLTQTQASFNGEPVDLTEHQGKIATWLGALAKSEHEPGTVEITYTNTNCVVDGMTGTNICMLSYKEGDTEENQTPTVQRIQFVNTNGEVTNRFATRDEALLHIAGGTFRNFVEMAPQGYPLDMYYPYTPAEIKVEYSPYAADSFTELKATEIPDNFRNGFGAFWDCDLKGVTAASDNNWYDLRVTLTTPAGSKQSQVISPAFRIDKLSGVKTTKTFSGVLDFSGGAFVNGDAAVEVYTANGIRVANRDLKPGLYIVRTDGHASKQMVK